MRQKLSVKRSLYPTVIIILSVALALCILQIPSAKGEDNGQEERVLVIPVQTETKTWDPMVGYGAGSDMITYNIYEGLLSVERLENGSWVFKPLLATSWEESENHTVWTFHLREGVVFHDGTPFNSSAVRFWFDRMLGVNRGPAWIYSTYIDRVVEVDTYTVRIYLKRPIPSFDFKCIMSNVFGAYGIVSPTYVLSHTTEEDPWAEDWMYDHTCGTGPYMLVNVSHGVESVWARFPDYWGGWEGPHVDKVVFKVVSDPQVQMMMFLRGEVDLYGPTRDQVPGVLAAMPEAILDVDREYLSVTYIFMNMGKPGPLQDINVRKAISYAFDYEGVINYVYAGYARPARGPLPHGIPYWDPELSMYKTNLTLAREYMANSSYPDGFEATIVAGPGDWEQVAEVFQSNMAEIGITVNIEVMPYATLWDLMQNATTAPEFTIALWYPDYPTADVYLTPVFGPLETAWQNWSFYNNSEVNALLEEGRYEFNETQRAQIYMEIQRKIVEDAPCIFMYEPDRLTFLQPYVEGFKRSPIHNGYRIYDISIEGKYPSEPPPSTSPPTFWEKYGPIITGTIVVLAMIAISAIYFTRRS